MVYKKFITRALLAAWIAIWCLFLIRPFFKKPLFSEYSALLARSAEEKRAYVTGEELYDFVEFCRKNVEGPATYDLFGVEYNSLDYRRVKYYLYPNMDMQPCPDYVFVYKAEGFNRPGYDLFKSMSDETYILKRTK